jgi:hypothetical protein
MASSAYRGGRTRLSPWQPRFCGSAHLIRSQSQTEKVQVMRVIGCFSFFLCVTISVATCVIPEVALARGGFGSGGGAHFAAGGSHAASGGAHFVFRSGHSRITGTRVNPEFSAVRQHGHAHDARNRNAAFGAGYWPWDWNYYSEAAGSTQPEVEPASLPPGEENPALLPPCHETQMGVTIVRGKSCRA